MCCVLSSSKSRWRRRSAALASRWTGQDKSKATQSERNSTSKRTPSGLEGQDEGGSREGRGAGRVLYLPLAEPRRSPSRKSAPGFI